MYEHYLEWGKENKVGSISDPWKVEMVKPKSHSFACLRGNVKAGEQRWIVYFVFAILSALPHRTPLMDLMLATYAALVDFDMVCRRAGRFFTPAELTQFQEAGELFCVGYNALAVHCQQTGLRLFKVVPKHHMLTHIIWDFGPQANPRAVHNYIDESVIGNIRKIAAAVHPDAIGTRVLQRYILWSSIRWFGFLCRGL